MVWFLDLDRINLDSSIHFNNLKMDRIKIYSIQIKRINYRASLYCYLPDHIISIINNLHRKFKENCLATWWLTIIDKLGRRCNEIKSVLKYIPVPGYACMWARLHVAFLRVQETCILESGCDDRDQRIEFMYVFQLSHTELKLQKNIHNSSHALSRYYDKLIRLYCNNCYL